MKIWYAALVVLSCLPAVGCRTNPRIAALQRDNRLKEDEIYRLRWQVEDYQEELARCRESLDGGAAPARGAPHGESILQRLGAAADAPPSEFSVQVGEAMSPDQFLESRDLTEPFEGPILSFPAPAGDDATAPTWPEPAELEPTDEAPRWSPPPSRQEEIEPPSDAPPAEPPGAAPGDLPAEPPVDAVPAPASPARDSRGVSRIRIDADATGGHRLDGGPGDDGLRVVIELLDDGGRPLRVPAEVSIVLLDPNPALQSDPTRAARGDFCEEDALVARWDFTTEEVAAAIRASQGGERGIPLKVVWRDKVPQSEALHLFVRYTTVDDRLLQDRIELRIRLKGSADSAGWQRAPEPRPPAAAEEDRATSQPDPPAVSTRLASRPRAASDEEAPASPPRRQRPRWSPDRP